MGEETHGQGRRHAEGQVYSSPARLPAISTASLEFLKNLCWSAIPGNFRLTKL